MAEEIKQMKPIWFFIGLVMLSIGGLVFIAVIYYFIFPSKTTTVLQHVHPNLWWGALMLIVGAIFLLITRNKRVE